MRIRNTAVLTLSTILLAALAAGAAVKEIPAQLPAADNKAPDTSKPVKVYLMMGQSNMVGMGELNGGGIRWGSEFIDPVVSVYEGKYDPKADYDKLTPIKTQKLEKFGGVSPTPFPGGGTQIVRGTLKMKTTGVYEFRPGYGDSMNNIMEIGGKEVYRKEPGQDAQHTPMKIEAGK